MRNHLLRNHCHTSLYKPKAHSMMVWFTYIVDVQSLNRASLLATPWTAAHQASLSFTISWSVLKLVSIESMMPSNHLILCCPLLLLPSIFPNICIRWPKYWSLSFNISPSNDYSGLISFRMDWLDLLAVQEIFSRGFSNITVQKHQLFGTQPLYGPNLTSAND